MRPGAQWSRMNPLALRPKPRLPAVGGRDSRFIGALIHHEQGSLRHKVARDASKEPFGGKDG